MSYLYNEVWRWDVTRQRAKVDPYSPLLMSCKLGIILVIQGNTRQGSGDGGWVAGVNLFENDWREMGEAQGVAQTGTKFKSNMTSEEEIE